MLGKKKWRQKEMLVVATANAVSQIITVSYEQRLEQETVREALKTLSETAK